MSLILDALRKADAERQSHLSASALGDASVKSAPEGPHWRWTIAVLLLASLGLAVGWWLWTSSEAPAGQEQLSSAQAKPPVVDEVVEERVVKEEVAEMVAPAVDEETEPVLPTTAPEATASQPRLQALYESTRAADTSADHKRPLAATDSVADLYRHDEQLPSFAAASPRAIAEFPAETPDREQIGEIRDLPLAVQNRIPTLMYVGHDYLEGSRPSVVINGQRYYEGQELVAELNLSLERIEQQGIILRLDRHRFRLRALSSWVNM